MAPPPTGDQATPTTSKSADVIRITQLEDQLERSRDQCEALERQVAQLKHSVHCWERETHSARQAAGQLSSQPRQDGALTAEEVKELQDRHKV